jgi:putative copper export protein
VGLTDDGACLVAQQVHVDGVLGHQLGDEALLADAGEVVRWGLPIAKTVMNFSMAIAGGSLAFAAFALTPGSKALDRVQNLSAFGAGTWAASAALVFVFTYLSVAGTSIRFDETFGQSLFMFATQIELGRALALNTLVAVALSTLVLAFRSLTSSLLLAALSLAAIVPLALIGHAAGTAGHAMAVNAIGMHLVAVVIWVGGLVALFISRSTDAGESATLIRRYSTLALAAFGLVAISGVASAVKQKAATLGRTVRIIGVQAENAAAYPPSLAAGEPVNVEVHPTICDGIAVARPGTLNFDIIKDTVDEVVTVSDDDTARALVMLLERAKLVVEPAGAVGVAAIMAKKIKNSGKTVAILSGGNIDPLLLQRIVGHGLAASERYLKLRVMLPDRPGQLARTAEIVSEQNANVVEVLHTRHGRGLQISEVELELHIETRGKEHRKQVVKALRDEGYKVRISDDI